MEYADDDGSVISETGTETYSTDTGSVITQTEVAGVDVIVYVTGVEG